MASRDWGACGRANTALTLDYARRVAVIRKVQPQSGTPLAPLPPEFASDTQVATVQYRGDTPSFPVFDALLGVTPVRVMLDSGNQGVTIDAAWLAQLRASGATQPFRQVDASTTYRAMPLTIAGMTVLMVDIVASVEQLKVAGQADPQLVKIGFGRCASSV